MRLVVWSPRLVDEPLYAKDKFGHVEVDKETRWVAAQIDVGKDLGIVDWFQRRDGLHLDDHEISIADAITAPVTRLNGASTSTGVAQASATPRGFTECRV